MSDRLNILRSVLVVVDLQEAFAPAIADFAEIVRRALIVVQGCKILGVPVIATEQMPAKLGPTVAPLRNILQSVGDGTSIPLLGKTTFSACAAQGFSSQLGGREQVLLCGIETHICVNQTALDLLANNRQVHLLTDAVGSRFARDHDAALQKLFAAGVIPSSVEMALFELMGDAMHEHFRAIQKLIK